MQAPEFKIPVQTRIVWKGLVPLPQDGIILSKVPLWTHFVLLKLSTYEIISFIAHDTIKILIKTIGNSTYLPTEFHYDESSKYKSVNDMTHSYQHW